MEFLADFKFDISDIAGKKNLANYLSRLCPAKDGAVNTAVTRAEDTLGFWDEAEDLQSHSTLGILNICDVDPMAKEQQSFTEFSADGRTSNVRPEVNGVITVFDEPTLLEHVKKS